MKSKLIIVRERNRNDAVKGKISIESLIRWPTFIGSSIIICSIIKSYVFYATYGIQFTNYISFSEAVLLFLHEVAILVWYMLFIATLVIAIYFLLRKYSPSLTTEEIFIPDNSSPFSNRVANSIHKIVVLCLALYPLFYLFYFIVKSLERYSSQKIFVYHLVAFLFIELFIITVVLLNWKRKFPVKKKLVKPFLAWLVFSYILLFYTWSLARQLFLFHRNGINKEVSGIKNNVVRRFNLVDSSNPVDSTVSFQNIYPDSVAHFQDEQALRQVQFIGSTANYLFFYDQGRKVSVVIDVRTFDQVEYGEYRDLPGFSIFDLLYH